MAFKDWLKEYRESQGQQSTTSTKNTQESTSGSTGSGDSGSSFRDSLTAYREAKATESVTGWAELSINLINDFQSRSSNWFDEEEYNSHYDRFNGLLAQADGWRKQYAGNKEATSYIDSVVDALSKAKSYSYDYHKYYSQWNSNEDYQTYKKGQKDYEDMLNFDLEAGQKEIEDLEAVKAEYKKWRLLSPSEDVQAKYRQFAAEYGDINGLENRISEKQAYLNRAKRLQEGVALSSVNNPESEYYDSEFGKYTEYAGSTWIDNGVDRFFSWDKNAGMKTGYEDIRYDYINDPDAVSNALSSSTNNADLQLLSGLQVYRNMTDEQVSIYNYYYAKNGKEAADKYLDSIQESLNTQLGTELAEFMEDKTFLELAFGISAGLDQFSSGIRNVVNTEDDYIPPSVTQVASGMVRDDLADDGITLPDWLGGASLGQAAYDAVTTTANMAPSILASAVVSSVNPTAGQIVGNTLMGASAAGNAYAEVLNMGYSKSQARAYSTMVGASEAGLQYLLGGISKMGGKLTGEALRKILDGVDNAIFRTAIQLGGNMLSEGMEEGLQEIITPWFKELALHLDEDINWSEVAYSSLLGAVTAGFMEGSGTLAGYAQNEAQYRSTGKDIKYADGGVDALMNLANDVAGVSEGKYQKQLNKQTAAVGKNATNRRVGMLFETVQNANNQANASANQADIAKSLTRKGFNTETANDIAEAIVASYNGQELTQAQRKLLESVKKSKVVQNAIANIAYNEQSTMGQRSQKIRDFTDEVRVGVISKTAGVDLTGKKTAAEEFTPKGEYQVSDNTKAFRTDTNEDIEIKGVASISKGEMLLDIGDGKTINSKDVSYASEQDALIYEAIANLGDKINAKTANELVSLYDGKNAALFARGVAQAYTYGFHNYDKAELASKSSFASDLTSEQRNEAYRLGKDYRPVKDRADKDNAHTTKAPAEKGVYYRDQNGNTTDIGTYLKSSNVKLNDRQKTAIEAMRKFSETMGARFSVFETWKENGKTYYLDENGVKQEGNPNGFYDPRTGEIYISLEAGAVSSNGFRDTMLFTIAHEMTHFMKQWSPEHFTKISKIVFSQAGFKGRVSEMVAEKMEARKKKGKPISYDTAVEEVVADAMETILKDGKVVEFMAEVKQKDYTAWQKLKGWFKNLEKFLRKLVTAYRGEHANTTEGDMVANFAEETIRQIQQIWAEGAVAAGDNYQGAEVQKNTTDDGGEIRNSIRTTEDGIKYVKLDGNIFLKSDGTVMTPREAYNSLIGQKITMEDGDVITFVKNIPGRDLYKELFRKLPGYTPGIDVKAVSDSINQNIVEVLAASSIQTRNDPQKHQHIGIKDFDQREVYITDGNEVYRLELCIANLTDGTKIAYVKRYLDIADQSVATKIKKAETAGQTRLNQPSDKTVSQPEDDVKSESVEAMDIELDEDTESAAPSALMSEKTWSESDYVQEREKAAQEISKAIGVSVKKAKAYIDSVNSIAKMIAEDRVRLDYFSSPGRSSFVSNVEYGGSFDFSTLCKKRRLLTGTFTAIQKALPNTALTADEILKIRNRMKKAGLEVSCGLCYVEGSRANMGQFAKEFLKLYKQYYPDAWQPNLADVNTPDGIEWVRINHPECYEQYEYFWNHYGTLKPGDKNLFASQQKPKLYQLHTEYKGEILDKFNDDDNVEEKNLNGGIRLQSFSDFEIVHLIDTMQIIMDMSRVGLAGQAYTKVPDFAWALGDTGLKINLSLISKGVDENGKLIFDDVEGMPIETAVALRNRYSKNVGTILVAFNDEQLMAAMADDRVDFIIPFHRSQWKKSQYEAMGLPAKTKDYTYMQNEKFIKPQYHEYRGRMVKDKATNYMPNEYWDFSKSGKDNAQAYLEMCARNNKRPKFYKLLQNNGDGSYSLKADGSTDGYWKLLIDFKMYDNAGVGSPQMPVKPDFNMEEATRMLNEYKGGHSNFPVAQGIVDEFVQEYKDSHQGALYQDRTDDSVSNRSLLANALEAAAKNDIERNKIQEYKSKIALIETEEKKLRELNAQIKELSFAEGPRDTKRIKDLRFDANQASNRINTYDKQLLRLEASKPLQDVLEREKKKAYQKAEKRGKEALEKQRERAAKTQRELLERWQDTRKKGIESREKTAMRHKIQSVVAELNQLLLNGDKKRHVPDSLKKAVADALALVNMDTVGAEERAAKYAALIAKETDPDKIDAYTMTMENILRQGEKMGQRLKELRDAYEEISESDDPDIANAYDPVIAGSLKELAQSIGDTSLRNMSLAQLSDVYDMYRMVLTRVRDANKSFLNAKKEAISNLASRVVGEVKKVGGEHKYRAAVLDFVKKFGWNNLKPVYAFEHIGSTTLTDAFNNVRAGEDTWAKDVTEARAYYLEKSKKYDYDSWDFKKKYSFESASGIEFELTLEQILSLYAYSKRDQAHDHLRLGGFVFDSNIETYKDKDGKSGKSILKYRVNTADAHQITPEILASITGELSKEQMDFVDEMQDYLSTVMGAKGNEVTMQMYGVKLFKEKFYFPLKSAKQFMFEQNEVSGEVRIKNSGFTNKVVAKANNPVILSNFMEVWAGHVNDMSMYHSFVLPLEDFNRIFNYNSPKMEGQPSVSVKGTIQSAYSPAAVNYVRQLITDLNGGARTDPTTDIISKMMGLFKKGAVFASASVVVQQPSAIARAFALVDSKYFIGPKVDHKRHKALWSEVKQYAPVAIIKEMGYFDTNMGKSTQDFILAKEYSGIGEKMKALVTDSGYRDEILSKAPALADELAWCSIWEAVKRETKDKNPGMDVKSEEFLKKAGARFTEVITKTQVYDSVLSRSGLMRSKDTGMKMATAFMAEPTTSMNMIIDALLQGKRGNRRYARKTIGAVIAAQILNSILVSFVYAGRDDDEDETYIEKYVGTFTAEMLDGLNPLTYIPFIKDIVSIVQGYDVERSDMAVISDLWKAIENLGKDNMSGYRKVESFVGSIAQLFGLPVKNIMRDARGLWQAYESIFKSEPVTGAGIRYAVKSSVPKWLGGGDVSNQQQLYEAYLNGDQKHIARVKARFKDQNAINNAIRKSLRENDPRIREAAIAWNANDLDEYMRIAKEIIAEKHFVQDDVVMAIRAEANALTPDDGTETASKAKGMFTAEKFAEAISQGDQAMANAIKTDIIQTAEKNGKTQKEAQKSFVSSAKSELKDMFLAGDVSEKQAIDALTTYCGLDKDDAKADVQYWAFNQDYPNISVDDAWFDKYYDDVADSGIRIDVYMNYRNQAKNVTGEDKKERKMAIINSLPITSAQKDALYFAEGWAESKLYEAPWH